MVITHYGFEFFRVQFGDIVMAINPISKELSEKSVRFGADIAVIGSFLPEHSGVEQVRFGGKEPFVIDSPGEYETKGVVVKGWYAPLKDSTQQRRVIYMVELEGMNLCFLTGLCDTNIPREIMEELSEVDVLFVPFGEEGLLSPALAYKLAVGLEPKIIIPARYNESSLKLFLKEAGALDLKPIEKLTIRKRDLVDKEAEVVVIKAI
jgi:hypothetical protein